jgi:hypothetical protein
VNGPDKLLRVASITASARRSALRFEPDQTQPSIAGQAVQRRRKLADLLQALTDCPKARPVCIHERARRGTGPLARLMQLFDEFAHGWAGFG